MTRIDLHESSKLTFVEGAAASTPAAGLVVIYAKSDGLLYSKDDAGGESAVSGAGGGGSVATDAIWDAKGDLAGGTGANTAAKLTVGTNGHTLIADSAQSTGLKWGVSPGTILAYVQYTGGNVDTTSTSLADADATNLIITFTAPPSGNVLVRLTATAAVNANGAGPVGNTYAWGLRESTTDIEAGNHVVRSEVTGATTSTYQGAIKEFIRTGLTPGASYSYKWAHKVGNSAGSGRITTASGSPAVMTVVALP